MKRRFFIIGIVQLLWLVYFCANDLTGIETTNGATAIASINGIEGKTAPNSQVFIFDTSYIPFVDSGFGIGTASNVGGTYKLTFNRIGEYNIFVYTPDIISGFLNQIRIDSSLTSKEVSFTLQEPGVIEGIVQCNETGPILVYLQGTSLFRVLEKSGNFTINQIPPGSYKLKALLLQDITSKRILRTSQLQKVDIISGKTTSISIGL